MCELFSSAGIITFSMQHIQINCAKFIGDSENRQRMNNQIVKE